MDAGGERVWSLTFEHSPVGMAVVGLDGRWSQVNQSLSDMVGYSRDRLLGMTFQDITHPEDLEPDLELLRACLAGERQSYRLVKRYVHADGHLVWGDLSVALVRDEAGEPIHFISQILDITEQRSHRERLEEATRELQAANADLEQFAAVVSHDLKTPLTSVRASLEMLHDAMPQIPVSLPEANRASRARDLAAKAAASAERMGALVDALLAYATTGTRSFGVRGDGGASGMSELAVVVPQALTDVEVMVTSSETTVRLDDSLQSAPALDVSPALVRTMVVNLVSNAVKYRDPKRPLTVEIAASEPPDLDGQVLVTVSNDGPSVPASERERLFGMFSRAEDTTAADGLQVSGFGIGLAACRRITAWHGGRIWMDEPETGTGVIVSFTLPVASGGGRGRSVGGMVTDAGRHGTDGADAPGGIGGIGGIGGVIGGGGNSETDGTPGISVLADASGLGSLGGGGRDLVGA